MSNPNAEPQGYVDLTCHFCGDLFAVMHPTEDQIYLPVCPGCVHDGRGQGCEQVGEVARG